MQVEFNTHSTFTQLPCIVAPFPRLPYLDVACHPLWCLSCHAQLEFEVSGPTVAGEGEVKVLGRLARPRHQHSVTPDDTHSEYWTAVSFASPFTALPYCLLVGSKLYSY